MLSSFSSELTTVAVISLFLGCIGGVCLTLSCLHLVGIYDNVPLFSLSVYILLTVPLFHAGEFLSAVPFRLQDAHSGSFLLNHSMIYHCAMAASLIEFVVEGALIPSWWKVVQASNGSVVFFGILTTFFYGVRVVAMVQCGSNFSLQLEDTHREDHVLVVHGLYSWLRHPSYFGWFWRTVCAQLILMNPVCFVVHTVATWVFFRQRIRIEEERLSHNEFFGEKYVQYRKCTRTGIPFIS